MAIADDDPDHRDLLGAYFRARGYNVLTAATGAETLELLSREHADIVLLDVVMPDVDGKQVLERVRSRHAPVDLPIVLMTALSSPGDVVRGLSLGANDYVTKPFNMDVVGARVRTQLELKSARDSAVRLRDALGIAHARITSLAGAAHPSEWASQIRRVLSGCVRGAVPSVQVLLDAGQWVDGTPPRPITVQDLARLEEEKAFQERDHFLFAIPGSNGGILGTFSILESEVLRAERRQAMVAFADQLGRALELELRSRAAARSNTTRSGKAPHNDAVRTCPTCARCYPSGITQCTQDGSPLGDYYPGVSYELDQRYTLTKLLGEGSMGRVFAAKDNHLNRRVAIKVLRTELGVDPDLRRRFSREAMLGAALEHPCICGIHDFGETALGSPFIVMERLIGEDLASICQRQGPGSPQQVAKMLRDAARGLRHAHQAGVVHRDVKPSNILVRLGPGGVSAVVLDFGIAKRPATDCLGTRPGVMIGTPYYMAPEQLMGDEADARSDIFALALVGYEAYTGSSARRAGSTLSSLTRPDSLVLEWPENTPAIVREAFARAVAWDSDARPKDVLYWADCFCADLASIEPHGSWQLSRHRSPKTRNSTHD